MGRVNEEEEVQISIENDLLNRSVEASHLSNFLVSEASFRASESYVINVNAPWGYGKSFFLKGWYKNLQELKIATVYYDAWSNDFSSDPLLSFVSEVGSELKEILRQKTKAYEAVEKTLKSGAKLALSAAPIIAGQVLRKFSGVDLEDEQLQGLSGDAIEDLGEAIASKALQSVEERKQNVEVFREQLTKLVSELEKGKTVDIPVFIFVDELDRCRPLFAIELLESIKHFFSVPGLIFVISTDTSQLSHSIQSVYGNNFNAHGYLKRFFNMEYQLDSPELSDFCDLICSPFIDRYPKKIVTSENYGMASILESIAIHLKLSLRDIQQIALLINASLPEIIRYENYCHATPLIFLASLYHKQPSLFRTLEQGHTYHSAQVVFQALSEDPEVGEPVGWNYEWFEYDELGRETRKSASFDYIEFLNIYYGTLEKRARDFENTYRGGFQEHNPDKLAIIELLREEARGKIKSSVTDFLALKKYASAIRRAGKFS